MSLRYQQDLKEWEKDGRAQEAAVAFIRQQLSAIAGAIRAVLNASGVTLKESEIHTLFNDLRPSINDVKNEIYRHYQGMLAGTGLLDIEMDRAYEETSQIERETLGLLAHAHPSSKVHERSTSSETTQFVNPTDIPPIDVLQNMAPQDIGMFLLSHLQGPHANRETEWMLRWIARDHYDDNPAVLGPLSEGIQYLEREGLVVPNVHSSHPGKKVLALSRQGLALLQEHKARQGATGEPSMPSIAKMLPAPKDVLALSREELAACILESLNAEAATRSHGEEDYKEHQRNYLRTVHDIYNSREVEDQFNSAWRWLIEQNYLSEDTRDLNAGWYRLTTKGRAVTIRDQIVVPRVPRNVNPGPAPDFSALINDVGLRKQLLVLWEETVLCYGADAHLSTVVMLGSLLEGALLGKALANPADANRAIASPKDVGSVKPFERWHLSNFIDVAIECGWVHKTRGDFTDVLRGYRNLIHPFKAKDVGYRIDKGAASICWQVVLSTLDDLGITRHQ